jgi:uncharacterized protein YciI
MKKIAVSLLVLLGVVAMTSHAEEPDIRFVIIHKAGHAWNPDRSIFQQPWILANPESGEDGVTHVAHYRSLLADGKLELGGPFPEVKATEGVQVGMMIPPQGLSKKELERFAGDDPAVKAGILTFEIRPWLIGMKKDGG